MIWVIQWNETPITHAAIRGSCVILDGLDKLTPDVLSSLVRLIEHGELDLPDGRRITAHPEFRCIALAHPPTATNWITPEINGMFHWIRVQPLPTSELHSVLLAYPTNQHPILLALGGAISLVAVRLKYVANFFRHDLPPIISIITTYLHTSSAVVLQTLHYRTEGEQTYYCVENGDREVQKQVTIISAVCTTLAELPDVLLGSAGGARGRLSLHPKNVFMRPRQKFVIHQRGLIY